MRNLIMFLPTVNKGGMEKNFFSTAKNLKKKGINLSAISCSKNKFIKKFNISNNSGVLEFDRLNLNLKFLISFIVLIIKNFKKKYPVLSFQGNIPAIIASKIIGCKIYIRLNSHPDLFLKNSFKKILFIFFYKMADNIIVNSKRVKDTLKKEFNLKSNLIYNEIDKDEIKAKSKYKIKLNFLNNYPLFVSVGRMDKNKNHIFLIEAFNKLKKYLKFNLLIIGSGPQEKTLLNKVKEYNLNHIIKIIGYKDNPYPYIKKSNFFVLTSFVEGYPNVLLEAGILGKIVISSNCSGSKEIINNDDRGYLFNINSFIKFKNILHNLKNQKKSIKKINLLKKYIIKNHKKDHSEKYINLIFGEKNKNH